MSRHLYNVGEAVVLIPHWGHYLKTPGDYVVSAQMPPLGNELQYRIKCASEPYERVVAEHQLDRVEPPAPPPRETRAAPAAKRAKASKGRAVREAPKAASRARPRSRSRSRSR
jgi:hypothetical protein